MWFDVDTDDAGAWSWRLIAADGRPVATSDERFSSRADAEARAVRFREEAVSAALVIYADDGGAWHWQAEARDGRALATSGGSFTTRSGARADAEAVRQGLA